MTDATTISGRIDRALHRMVSEGFQPTSILLGRAEQVAMAAWIKSAFPKIPGLQDIDLREQLPDMKYRGVQLAVDEAPSLLRVEGVWVDVICEGPPSVQ